MRDPPPEVTPPELAPGEARPAGVPPLVGSRSGAARRWRRRTLLAAALVIVVAAGVVTALALRHRPHGGPAAAGRWQVMDTAALPSGTVVNGLACPAPGVCVLTGFVRGETYQTRVYSARLRGDAWTELPIAGPASLPGSARIAALSEVGCVSATDCWAVAHALQGVLDYPILVHYDGTQWTVWPDPARYADTVRHLTCIPGAYCLTVGRAWLRSSGGTWARVAGPDADVEGPVSCAAVDSCDAFAAAPHRTIAAWHYDGRAWRGVGSSLAPGQATALASVQALACARPDRCVAQIQVTGEPNIFVTKLAALGPSGWDLAPIDDTYTWWGVACVNERDCWAVGSHSTTGGAVSGTFQDTDGVLAVAHYDGVGWTVAADPAPAVRGSLLAVTCASSGACYATGLGNDTGPPIVLRFGAA